MNKLCLSILLLFTVNVNSQNLSELYNDVKSSVVVINIITVESRKVNDDLNLLAKATQGSGVLISEDGLIWTAAHVVQSAELVQVEFLDGELFEADVLSSNPLADVALIRIKGEFHLKNKKVAKIGNSDMQNIGDDIFVIGAPFGIKQTLSKGIISGKHYLDPSNSSLANVEFLQTDAAINHGNSGGPMFNMKGEIIGITSRIHSESGSFNGLAFAISSNTAKKTLMDEPNLWTGMNSILVTGNVAKALNIPQESGLLVLSLSSKGAASKIGLRGGFIEATIDGVKLLIGGDIILNFIDVNFSQSNFKNLIKTKMDTYKKGDNLSMTILRHGKIISLEFIKE
ncbi:serine protease Do [Winogradskyella pacifica]|uniref:Serine protease Do n=1 Tax=Winogradskyella pacifica TaxID=664642 RepID=A0A3D9LNW1_9FLAO|nr:trypsin-like peptidase domain-containing protein [Winogradskyella pacifica]REE07693.1 serine protease Do [Winogradskyella pacifica]